MLSAAIRATKRNRRAWAKSFFGCCMRVPVILPVPPSFIRKFTMNSDVACSVDSLTVYFLINNEQIIVTGLFHGARDPRAVASVLQNRKT